MKKKQKYFIIILTFLISIIGFIVYKFHQIDLDLNPDPNFNTRYTKDYEEHLFQKIKIGENLKQVSETIGEPLSIDKLEYVEKILYGNNPSKEELFRTPKIGLKLSKGNDSAGYCQASIDKNGKIIDILSNISIIDSLSQLESFSKGKIFEIIGKPKIELKCDCDNSYILSYSKLKNGSYRGKMPVINLRRLLINDNKVIKKIIQEGNPYDKYQGICLIKEN